MSGQWSIAPPPAEGFKYRQGTVERGPPPPDPPPAAAPGAYQPATLGLGPGLGLQGRPARSPAKAARANLGAVRSFAGAGPSGAAQKRPGTLILIVDR